MSRTRPVLLTIAILVGLVLATAAGLALLLSHEPAFYRQAEPAAASRKRLSSEFQANVISLIDSIINLKPEWGGSFTAAQVNSYLEEDFVKSGAREKLLPERMRAPRLSIDNDRLRIGFRYGGQRWNTVINLDLRVWLVAEEQNVVGVEFRNLRAGALPVSGQSLLETITEAARQMNVETTWYRHRGNPVALLRFQADQPRPTIHIHRLELLPGELRVSGQPLETSPRLTPVVDAR